MQIFDHTKTILFVIIFPWGCTEFREFHEFSMFREIPEYSRFVAILILHPTWHNTTSFQRHSCQPISWHSTEETKPNSTKPSNTTTTTFYGHFFGESVPEETFSHTPFWSPSNLYQLLPSTTIHSILPVQIMCLAIFLLNLSPRPLWSTSWSGALHFILHTFLHPISVLLPQHMPIPSQLILL